ncbi:MAG: YhfC family glutamic-type intramembrane protease [Oscillospiraceae bacterium]|nr:YhfC family glutamic-type intramembrane protease [Oscillospiraceae bacterium]
MISSSNIAAICFTLVISILLPIAIWIWLGSTRKRVSIPVIAGAAGFIIAQFVIRLPILQLLWKTDSFAKFVKGNKLIYFIFLAFTAALIETAFRLLILKGLLKDRLSFDCAFACGLGHGGAESIALIGLTYINNLVISIMINSGAASDLINDSVIAALRDTPASSFIAAGLERVFVLAFQISLSVILSYFIVMGRTWTGAALCFGVHFAVDFVIPLFLSSGISVWICEAITLAVAVAAVVVSLLLKKIFPVMVIPKDAAEDALSKGF